MSDCYHGLAPSYFSSYFTPVVNMHHYDTRAASRDDLFLQRKNTFIYGIRSIQYSGARRGILCLHQLETHNLSQHLDYKLKPYSFHSTWQTDASTQAHELIMPPAEIWLSAFPIFCTGAGCWGGVSVVGKLTFLLWMACFARGPCAWWGPELWLSCGWCWYFGCKIPVPYFQTLTLGAIIPHLIWK